MGSDQHLAPSDEARRRGYETSVVSVKGLAIFAVCLIATAAVLHTAIWYLFRGYLAFDAKSERPASALTDAAVTPRFRNAMPPVPWIQPSPGDANVPEGDLQLMYSKEDAAFRQMGWVIDDQTHVPLRIPQAAIDAVIRQESAAQKQPAAATESKSVSQ